ncbi:MAG: hypothetical protein KDC40_14715 [Actinobacteria bacterium]|nr:hypothetical protein [Actinomycetota bacterium]HRY09005.1 hypothetical protein [Candidatus Nanopelagicales bacterium]
MTESNDEEVPLDEEAYSTPEDAIEQHLPGNITEIPEVSEAPPQASDD